MFYPQRRAAIGQLRSDHQGQRRKGDQIQHFAPPRSHLDPDGFPPIDLPGPASASHDWLGHPPRSTPHTRDHDRSSLDILATLSSVACGGPIGSSSVSPNRSYHGPADDGAQFSVETCVDLPRRRSTRLTSYD
ncbi:hypothetical protein HRG_012262 [Hirsutella rhossiliensis]